MRFQKNGWTIGAGVIGALALTVAIVVLPVLAAILASGLALHAYSIRARADHAAPSFVDALDCIATPPPPEPAQRIGAPTIAATHSEVAMRLSPRVCSDQGHVTGLEILLPDVMDHREAACQTSTWLDAIDRAARLRARLADRQIMTGRLCLSLPPTALTRIEFVDQVAFTLDAHDVLPSDLELRIDSSDGVATARQPLGRLGCSVALPAGSDALRRGEASVCWIGAALVRDVAKDPARRSLVSGFLRRAESRGLESVASGVGTAADAALLAQLGCAHLSGPAISFPLAPEAVAPWLSDRFKMTENGTSVPWRLDTPFARMDRLPSVIATMPNARARRAGGA